MKNFKIRNQGHKKGKIFRSLTLYQETKYFTLLKITKLIYYYNSNNIIFSQEFLYKNLNKFLKKDKMPQIHYNTLKNYIKILENLLVIDTECKLVIGEGRGFKKLKKFMFIINFENKKELEKQLLQAYLKYITAKKTAKLEEVNNIGELKYYLQTNIPNQQAQKIIIYNLGFNNKYNKYNKFLDFFLNLKSFLGIKIYDIIKFIRLIFNFFRRVNWQFDFNEKLKCLEKIKLKLEV